MKPSLWKALQSQVGRKALNAATGIGLIIFIIFHLAGNLTLFGSPGASCSRWYIHLAQKKASPAQGI